LAALVLVAAVAAGGDEVRPLKLCADFSSYSIPHKFKDDFELSGYRIKKIGGAVALEIGNHDMEVGLQFPHEGIEITLPAPVPVTDLKLGVGAGGVKIEALDENKTVIYAVTVPHDEKFVSVSVKPPSANKIALLRLTGGDGEGVLASICVMLKTVP